MPKQIQFQFIVAFMTKLSFSQSVLLRLATGLVVAGLSLSALANQLSGPQDAPQSVPVLHLMDIPDAPLMSAAALEKLKGKLSKFKKDSPARYSGRFAAWANKQAQLAYQACAQSPGDGQLNQTAGLSPFQAANPNKLELFCSELAQFGFEPVCDVMGIPALLQNSKKHGLLFSQMTTHYKPLSEISRPALLTRMAVLECSLRPTGLLAQPFSHPVKALFEPFAPQDVKTKQGIQSLLTSKVHFTAPDLPGKGELGTLDSEKKVVFWEQLPVPTMEQSEFVKP